MFGLLVGKPNLSPEEWFKLKPSQTLKKGFGAFHPEELASVPKLHLGVSHIPVETHVGDVVLAVVSFDIEWRIPMNPMRGLSFAMLDFFYKPRPAKGGFCWHL